MPDLKFLLDAEVDGQPERPKGPKLQIASLLYK